MAVIRTTCQLNVNVGRHRSADVSHSMKGSETRWQSRVALNLLEDGPNQQILFPSMPLHL